MPTYTKTTWVNNQAPSINATNLNKIEEGIEDAIEGVNSNSALIATKQNTLLAGDYISIDADVISGARQALLINVTYNSGIYTADISNVYLMITRALTAGYAPVMKYGNTLYHLYEKNSVDGDYYFRHIADDTGQVTYLAVDNNDTISSASESMHTDSTSVSYDGTASGLSAGTVKLAIDSLAPKTVNVTLVYTNWDANHQYTISDSNINASKMIVLTYPASMGATEYNALIAANIRPVSVTNGQMILESLGDVPTINLGIQLVIWG